MASSVGHSPKSSVEELQNALYARCVQADALLNQSDLLGFGVIPNNNNDKLMQCVQGLLKKNLLRAYGSGDNTSFKAVKKETAAKYQALSQDEAMLFSYIEASGREGIWTRTLKLRTNIHQSVVTRSIKNLESRGYIKPIRSVKAPGHTLYMLTSLTPSEGVTGGPWFTDGDLDTDFVEVLCNSIEAFVSSRSFYRASSSSTGSNPAVKKEKTGVKPQLESNNLRESGASIGVKRSHSNKPKEKLLPLPPGYKRYPTLGEIKRWLNASAITSVTLTEAHVEQLVDVLYYDGRIQKVLDGTAYKAVRQPAKKDERGLGTAFTEAPCGRCPVFHLCEEGGPVSASNCEYFVDWLKF
ncbi:MAG: 34-kDa subunit of RNA polymerase III (C) [Sclerophora amabilis]|nr:MAG: 34-kDa subunit of RNA polymerase III (C) [Sclerophora amabilis]